MIRTLRKLDEAQFFIQKLEENYENHPDFDYFLSAFISSSRSILWVMRAEFNGVNGWEKWFKSKEPSIEEQQFIKQINTIRVRSEKSHPLATSCCLTIDFPAESVTPKLKETLENWADKNMKIQLIPLDQLDDYKKIHHEEPVAIGTSGGIHRVIEEFPDEDVLEVCQRYLKTLQFLVTECLNKFRP